MTVSDFVLTTRGGKACGLLALAFSFSLAAPAYGHHLEKRFAVQPHPVVGVHNPSGSVTVRSWAKPEVLVVADHASGKVEVDAVQNGNRVELLTHTLSENISPDDLRADYQITVPEDSELEIHNDSGSIAVARVQGDMSVDTVAAGVNLEDISGYLMVRTVAGSFHCLRCAGRIEVTSISGNVQLIDARSPNVRAQTTTGNILFDGEFLPNGTYRLKNYSGLILVRFSPGDSFDLSATSVKGKVENEANLTPPLHSTHLAPQFGRSLFGTFNQGRAKVELSSFNGTISIRKRD